MGESTSVDTANNACSTKPKLDSYWNFRSVVFQVEDTLFSVLKHGFLVSGTPFEAMFSLPAVDPARVEGSSDDNPIVLEDTLAQDFRAFLRVIYPIGVEKVTSFEEWVGVLRLADKWSFSAIRKQAIDAITPLMSKVESHEKLRLGSTFHIQPWITEGLIDIATRRDLEFDHLQAKPYRFDANIIAKFFYIQSKAFVCQFPHVSYVGYRCNHCDIGVAYNVPEIVHYCEASYKANVTNLVQKCFADEIRDSAFAAIKLE